MSKRNYTLYLNEEVVNKAYDYAKENDLKNNEAIEKAINIVYGDEESENKWMDLFHGLDYESTFIKKELEQYRKAMNDFAVGFSKLNTDEIEGDLKDVLMNLFASLLKINSEA